MVEHKYTNHLIHETSPYLLQHAHNPVDWYPWGEEALALAKSKNLPIFLSIGYAACHWCHVMEKESFENEEIAKILNENFVPIKVDREERPDIDEIYMSAVNMMTGSGGWPLSVWLTPDLKPFFGGTYFPPDDRWGRIGFKNILLRISELWHTKREEILQSAENLTDAIKQLNVVSSTKITIDLQLWKRTATLLRNMHDSKYGGFGRAPKFPRAMDLMFLLRYYFYANDKSALDMVSTSLQAMANGGIFDQLGGGFHRYATDEKWLIPHFEKMLYDNALLPIVYLEYYQISKDEFYRRIALQTADFVLREMLSPEGGFYSSLDADSEGEEGKFYTWTKKEIEHLLDEKEEKLFASIYGVSDKGNWEGVNILHKTKSLEQAAKELGISRTKANELLKSARKKLLAARNERVRPATDDKIITSWNCLMIIALCKAYQISGTERFLVAAKKAIDFLRKKMLIKEHLYRTFGRGKAKHHGYLTDYALFVAALIEFYMSSFDIEYLLLALDLNELCLKYFWDDQEKAFFFVPITENNLLIKNRNEFDNVIPAGNSVSIGNLLTLYQFTGNDHFKEIALQAVSSCADKIQKSPLGFSYLLSVLEAELAKPKEIVISGRREKENFDKFVSEIWATFFPNKIIAWANPQFQRNNDQVASWPIFAGKFSDDNRVYICEDYSCQAPIDTLDGLREYLRTRGTVN